MANRERPGPTRSSAIAKAGVGVAILVGLLVTTDDQGFRESILIAMATGVLYGSYRIVYKRAAVRWWKAWVANFVVVIGLGIIAVLGGATPELVAEMLGLIAIPGAISAASLLPISRAFTRERNIPEEEEDESDQAVKSEVEATDSDSAGPKTWMRNTVVFLAVALVFGGGRALHPAGVRGIVRDAFVVAGAPDGYEQLKTEMIEVLAPAGAAAMCREEFGESYELNRAVQAYTVRHDRQMSTQSLVGRAEELGLSQSEKDLIDREAYTAAASLLEPNPERACQQLPDRFNSGEFDRQF